MALNALNLRTEVLGPGMVRALYHTADAAAVVEAANYFNDAWRSLPVNTVLTCVMVTGGTQIIKTYVVRASAAGGVTIALQATAAG